MSETKDTSRDNSFIDEKDGAGSSELVHEDKIRRLDVGLALLQGHTDDPPVSPEESKRIRRKIDWHLLPLLCLIYMGKLKLLLPCYIQSLTNYLNSSIY